MKRKMNLVKSTLENKKEHFSRKEVRDNFADMLCDTIDLDDRLFRKFWKEFFPKVTLSMKQTEYMMDYYGFILMKKVIESMDDYHRNYKLTDDQKWYYGVYVDDQIVIKLHNTKGGDFFFLFFFRILGGG